jgi:hypothetical protein
MRIVGILWNGTGDPKLTCDALPPAFTGLNGTTAAEQATDPQDIPCYVEHGLLRPSEHPS